MNEQENVAALRKLYADLGAGDILGVLNVMAEDIVWKQAMEGPQPFAGTLCGRDQFDAWFVQIEAISEIETFNVREFIAQGNKVVALGHYVQRVRATGKLWGSDWAHVWTFRGRRAIEGQVFEDTLARAAALDCLP